MSYVKHHMTRALSRHRLEQVSENVWRMRRPDSMGFRVLLTFNEEGIVIQGDIGLGEAQNGICSRGGYGIGWFGKTLSEDYLCSKFLSKTWQREVAREDIERWIEQAEDDEDRSNWKKLLEALGDETSEKELYEEGSDLFLDFWDYGVGTDYPVADAGWLCVIQLRFAVLYREWLTTTGS